MKVAAYCGSRPGVRPEYMDFAAKFGKALAENGHTLVFGGSHVGLMGAVANGVLDNGGNVIGVVPDVEYIKSVEHKTLTKTYYTATMSERRNKMIELSDVYVVLPGGPGTLDEMSEVYCLNQLDIDKKPCIMANVAGYYDMLKAFYTQMMTEGFLVDDSLDELIFVSSVEEIIDIIARL
jgi:uncharacterized protein (TIGR00730 family)